jgi:translocation and assembly module TamA
MSLVPGAAALAADPQTYQVDIVSTGNGAIDATLKATSELVALRAGAPVGPFGLIARARGDVERLKTVLESYGYYDSAVSITIDGRALNNPTLGDSLGALAKGSEARVSVTSKLGALYHVGKVTLDGDLPQSAAGAFGLKSGAPAVAADVLAAGTGLQAALQEQGYAFAKVDAPVAYQDASLPLLDVSFAVTAGPRVTIGEIRLQGLDRLHEKLIRRRLTIHPGQRFSPAAIEAARRDLLSLGPLLSISVDVGREADPEGAVPITFVFRERKRHAVTLNAAFSSDLGGSGGVTWTDRNVFGNAEQLSIKASVINLGGSDTNGVGYDTSAKLTIPEVGHRDQSLQLAVGAIKQSLQAYDQNAVTSGITLNRRLSSVWSAGVGVATANEHILQNGSSFNYTLVQLPLTLGYDSTHLASPLDDPTHGMRNSVSISPTQSLGRPSATFLISRVNLAAYVDLHGIGIGDPGRSVLALRALAGRAQGAGELSLPPDQRFYGGGSGTIRGYPYQLVGPVFRGTDIPVGGTAIAAGTVEFRQRFGANWGAAVFVDGGEVSASLKPLPSEFRVGVGAGLRYYTPIGPVRLDIAVPTKRDTYDNVVFRQRIGGPLAAELPAPPGNTYDQAFQVYIGLGQGF